MYIQPLPLTGAKYLISTAGGLDPMWAPDGKHLYYRQGQPNGGGPPYKIMSVGVQTLPTLTFSKPVPLPFDFTTVQGERRPYDITPDGKQFLVMLNATDVTSSAEAPQQQINVVLNWFTDLRQRVSAK